MTVAAVVVTYRRPELLMQCLRALQAQTHPVDEIIVVDNASGDGTAERVRKEFPEVTLRVLSENRGGAGGFHEGMRIATERDVDWIWVMDDDVEPELDALEALFASGKHEDDDTVALASLKVGTDGRVQEAHAGNYNPTWMRKTPSVPSRRATAESTSVPVQFSSFVGLLVRGAAVETVGLPEAGFFIWGDDLEYSLRLLEVGTIYLVPNSVVIHYDAFAQERKQAQVGARAWRTRPLDEYWRKYYEIRNPLLIAHRHVGSAARRMLAYGVGAYRVLRSGAAVAAFDRMEAVRIRLLSAAYRHGISGLCGPYVHPAHFPQRLLPDALYPLTGDAESLSSIVSAEPNPKVDGGDHS